MRPVLRVLLAALTLLLAATGMVPAHAANGSIAGTITAVGGPGLSGITVTAHAWDPVDEWWYDEFSTTTTAGGAYSVPVPPGTYMLEFRDPDGNRVPEYYDGQADIWDATVVTVGDGQAVTGKNADLAAAGHIAGTVSGGGAGLANASVTVYRYDAVEEWWYEAATADTDGSGAYDVGGIAPGTYRVGFHDWSGDWVDEFYVDQARVESAQDVTVSAGATQSISAQLAPAAYIGGTVTGVNGTPLTEVEVTAYSWNSVDGYWEDVAWADTGVDGGFTVSGLAPGTYRIRYWDYSSAGYLPEYHHDAATIGTATGITVAASTYTSISAQLSLGGKITGLVTDDAGTPLEDVAATIYEYDADSGTWEDFGGTSTLSDGRFALLHLRTGTYRVCFADYAHRVVDKCYADGTTAATGTGVAVTQGQATDVGQIYLMRPGAVYANTAAPSVSGTPQVGQTLTATPGSWSPAGATYAYQWYAGESAISGATGSTYAPTTADVGQGLKVRVTATWPATSRAAFSATTAAVAAAPVVTPTPTPTASTTPTPAPAPAPTATPTPPAPAPTAVVAVAKPKIKGILKVGKTLKVTAGSWAPATVTRKIQWLANGKVIKKATKARLLLTKALRGKRISVRVVASATGYLPVTVVVKAKGKVA